MASIRKRNGKYEVPVHAEGSLIAPETGERWVVSAGSDGKILLSPFGLAPLLRAATSAGQ